VAISLIVACRQDIPVQERPVISHPGLPSIEPVRIDLAELQAEGKITALTLNNSTSYFVYRGQAMGYEYEWLTMFANSQGLELEVKVVDDIPTMFDMLDRGEGDIIACNLAITSERRKLAEFSEPYNLTRQVLVQRLPEGAATMNVRELNSH